MTSIQSSPQPAWNRSRAAAPPRCAAIQRGKAGPKMAKLFADMSAVPVGSSSSQLTALNQCRKRIPARCRGSSAGNAVSAAAASSAGTGARRRREMRFTSSPAPTAVAATAGTTWRAKGSVAPLHVRVSQLVCGSVTTP